MNIGNIRILATLLATCWCCFGYSQESEKRLSVRFNHASLGEVVAELSKASGLHFYYDPIHKDSLSVTYQSESVSVDSILRAVLKNTPYHYFIDSAHENAFISYQKIIVNDLPPGLFARKSTTPRPAASQSLLRVNEQDGNQKIGLKSTLENKLFEIGPKTAEFGTGNANLAGYIRYAQTGEPVAGASVFIESPRIGVVTNQFGYFLLQIPKGRHVINVSGIGIRSTRRMIALYGDGRLDIETTEQVQSLKEVVISSDKVVNIRNVQLGLEKLTLQTIKQVPTVFGETDVLRVVLTLPGVKSVGEASMGFNVRGGASDQNLILYNDATIYNPSHFFGFFSAFNSEGIKDVELFKSSIPAYYGGRLSSVLSVTNREGNKKKFTGSAGIGLLTSRFNVEGPLIKDRTSFMVGGRMTYSNWLLKNLPGKADYKNSNAAFSDLDVHISHQFNEKNNLYITGYYSNDKSNLASDTTYRYYNRNISAKWKHVFNNKLFGVFLAGYDGYGYSNYSNLNNYESFKMKFNINQTSLKADFNYYLTNKHTINVGGSGIFYLLNPGTFTPRGSESLIIPQYMERERGLESAVYLNDKYDVSSALSLNGGIRYSIFNSLGPKTVIKYRAGVPKEENSVIETATYKSGKIIKTYHGPEFRLSARYAVTSDFSVKAGYNTMRQYIHMLSNTTAIAPTDIWKLSDYNIRPQYGDQASLGLYKNFKSNTIETSVEVYYKRMHDYLDYKSGANLVLNSHIETDVVNTKGKAYGVEFMVRKLAGKLNGWVSYTYSRTLLKVDDPASGEIINDGKFYPGNYDKPHDVTLIGNYRFSHRYSFSFNTAYSTGRPITLPIGKYWYGGGERLLYSDRNAYRIPDYFRIDIGFNIEGNHKVHQLTHNSWTVGVYNLTARKNAYSTYFTSENGSVNGYKLSIFSNPVPYINYNIRF